MILNYDFVICKICNKSFKQITHKHLLQHNITIEEYKDMFPNDLIRCIKSKELHVKNQNKTNMKKYGCNRPLQNKAIKEKADLTLLNHYNVNNAYNITGLNQKSQITQLKKYGAKTPFNTNSILRKKVDFSAQTINSKNKRMQTFKKTCITKYGVDHNWKTKSSYNKRISTMKKRYGITSVFQRQDILKKALINCKQTKEPNKPEKIILDIIGDQGWYCGNFSFWVTFKNGKHKNPDIKIHNQNKVIEHYGTYWHKDDNPSDLIALYEEIGFKCLVIWENELSNKNVLIKKIESFILN